MFELARAAAANGMNGCQVSLCVMIVLECDNTGLDSEKRAALIGKRNVTTIRLEVAPIAQKWLGVAFCTVILLFM